MAAEMRPQSERHFTCACGMWHKWEWGSRSMGTPSFIDITCPACHRSYQKLLTEWELTHWFGIYHRRGSAGFTGKIPTYKPERPNIGGDYGDLIKATTEK